MFYSKSKFTKFICIIFTFIVSLGYANDIALIKKGLNLAKTDTLKCRLLYDLGNAYESTNVDSSFFYLTQLLKTAKHSNNQKYEARAMYKIGYMHMYYTKDETMALEWVKKSIAIAKPINDYFSLAKSYQIMGIISIHQGIGTPTELLNKSIEFAKKDTDWRCLNDSYAIMSNYFNIIHKYDEARKFTELAMQISEKHDIDEWFNDGIDYCEILLLQGRKEQAHSLAIELDAAKQKLKKSKGQFIHLNNIGRLAKLLKKYDEAEKLFLESLENERKSSKVDTFHLYFIFRNLESLYVEQKLYEKAYDLSKKLTDVVLWLKEKRQTQNSKLEMTKLKASFDLEKKEVEIALLETKQKQQRILTLAIAAIALMLIAFLIFLYQNSRKIKLQKDSLSDLNATKDKLFAVLSHDLRSPVASLRNYMMLINWGALSQKEFAEATSRLNTQLSTVGNSLDNVLSWAITQMQGIKPKPVNTNVFEIIEEKILLLQGIIEVKQISIKNQVSPIAEVNFDKNHFKVIIRNLLQNALKFTEKGGNIIFDLEKDSVFTIITIKDDGIGIAQEKLHTLFILGKNQPTIGTSKERGTGLGLVLVKELTELNGGTISVESQLGHGTTFSIRIPNV